MTPVVLSSGGYRGRALPLLEAPTRRRARALDLQGAPLLQLRLLPQGGGSRPPHERAHDRAPQPGASARRRATCRNLAYAPAAAGWSRRGTLSCTERAGASWCSVSPRALSDGIASSGGGSTRPPCGLRLRGLRRQLRRPASLSDGRCARRQQNAPQRRPRTHRKVSPGPVHQAGSAGAVAGAQHLGVEDRGIAMSAADATARPGGAAAAKSGVI
jgi:hypothetical protein